MQAHGAELATAFAPELMNYSGQHPAVQRCAMQHSLNYLSEALQLWLATGEKINYSAQDNDILTAIGYSPDAPSRDDNREKFPPAQNMITPVEVPDWPRSSLSKNPCKPRHFARIKPCIHKMHGFACVFPPLHSLPAPVAAWPEATFAPGPLKRAGVAGRALRASTMKEFNFLILILVMRFQIS